MKRPPWSRHDCFRRVSLGQLLMSGLQSFSSRSTAWVSSSSSPSPAVTPRVSSSSLISLPIRYLTYSPFTQRIPDPFSGSVNRSVGTTDPLHVICKQRITDFVSSPIRCHSSHRRGISYEDHCPSRDSSSDNSPASPPAPRTTRAWWRTDDLRRLSKPTLSLSLLRLVQRTGQLVSRFRF